MDAVLQMQSHRHCVGRNAFPQCAGHTLANCCRQQDHLKLGNLSAWEAFTCGDLAKMLEGGLTVLSASSFSAFICILSARLEL